MLPDANASDFPNTLSIAQTPSAIAEYIRAQPPRPHPGSAPPLERQPACVSYQRGAIRPSPTA